MSYQSLEKAVEEIDSAYNAGEEEKAIRLARKAFSIGLKLKIESKAVWDLAKLLILLGENQHGLQLAKQQIQLVKTDDAFVNYSDLLRLAGHEEEAAVLLRHLIKERGPSIMLVGNLVELALSGLGWNTLDDLDSTDPNIAEILEAVNRRSSGFDPTNIDTRRQAYILAKMIVLGASEDEGDFIPPYWFFNVDEFEAAWFLRRLVAWLQAELIQATSVRAGDSMAIPLALALSKRLGIQFETTLPKTPGSIYLFSKLNSLKDIETVHSNDVLTVSLGINEPPSWRELLRPSPVNVVGLIAPVNIEWSDTETDRIASNILYEERNLPEDQFLPQILQFYKEHKERI